MIKQWKSPSLEILDVSLTMKGPGGGGGGGGHHSGGDRCGHKGHKGPKKDCPTPEVPPETPPSDS